MDSILIVGVETVVGGNVAAYLSAGSRARKVTGLCRAEHVRIDGCSTYHTDVRRCEEAVRWINDSKATQIVFCGAASHSSWESATVQIDESLIESTRVWAEAAQQSGCPITIISSDAVFSGPQMFHDEDSSSHCGSMQANCIRQAETAASEACPQALIVRTNAYGWSPRGEQGWIERQLAGLRKNRLADADYIRHGTPILATDLAGVLMRVWSEGLSGTFHIAGAERVSPLKFVQRLGDSFQLPWLSLERGGSLNECPTGFASGECSLQTKRIRKAICLAMPMISEGLARLAEQDSTGFRNRLLGREANSSERAA
ncbi:MAG: sugar nucleotide-binding protein [Planctomycetaceae bacterium]